MVKTIKQSYLVKLNYILLIMLFANAINADPENGYIYKYRANLFRKLVQDKLAENDITRAKNLGVN